MKGPDGTDESTSLNENSGTLHIEKAAPVKIDDCISETISLNKNSETVNAAPVKKYIPDKINKVVIVVTVILTCFVLSYFIHFSTCNDVPHVSAYQDYKFFRVTILTEYTLVRIIDNAELLLFSRYPNVDFYQLSGYEIGNLITFIRSCFLCIPSTSCDFYEKDLTFELNARLGYYIHIPDFKSCTLPNKCFLFTKEVSCKDLVKIYNILMT